MFLLALGLALPGCFANADPDVAESSAELQLLTLRSLAVTPREARVAPGGAQAFTATATLSNGARRDVTALVTWRSSNPRAATISNAPRSKGVATARANGQTVITAHLLGRFAAANLTVGPATLQAIVVSPNSPTIANGTTQQLTATGLYSDGSAVDLTTQVTWSSSDTSVAVIQAQGLAIGLSPGTTTIFADFNGVEGTTSLTVSAAVLVAIEVFPSNPSLAAGTLQQFTAVGFYSDGSTVDLTSSVAWDSSNGTVGSFVDPTGLLLAQAPGSTTITATQQGVTGATTATVTPAVLIAVTVLPSNATLAVGTSQAHVAVGTFSDGSTQDITSTANWSSSDEVVATVSDSSGSKGLAVALSPGTTTIFATMDAVTGITTLTVTQP
jgi:hypothetical protein